ncbi:MAG: hypothetical protein H6672_23195, partial [Anaerolineaceae bacterium]|nr:hypothetical protein [Anaerolineaceae bacterium]
MKRKYLFLVLAAFMSILLVLIMLSHTESLNSPILALNDLVPIEVDNVSQIQKLASLKEPGGLDALAFDPLDKRLASGNTDGEIHLIDTTTGSRIFTLDGNYPIKTIAFSPDGTLMAAGTQIGMSQGGLILWNLT